MYFGDARCLIWSDIPNNRLMRYDEVTGAVSIYREPSNYANGNRRDRQGRLITCEHGTRRVTRTEYDGTITVLMDRFEGKRLNSPNDVCVRSDDSIWFSDPPFGILSNYQGDIAPVELPSNIYRLDPKTGRATVVDNTRAGRTVSSSRPTRPSATSRTPSAASATSMPTTWSTTAPSLPTSAS